MSTEERSWRLFSTFTQHELTLLDDRVQITLGSKFEVNDFTGFEAEPNGRVLWNISPTQSVWGGISRAARTPSRTEQDMRLDAMVLPPSDASGGLPLQISVHGDQDFDAEYLLAYETGYRVNLGKSLSVDVASFYNKYTNLRSAEPTAPTLGPTAETLYVVMPLVAANKMSGATYGAELFADWRPTPQISLRSGYTSLRMDIHRDADSLDVSSPDPAGASPRHQFSLRSSLDLPGQFQQDVTWRYVGRLGGLDVPSYHSLDANLMWVPTSSLSLSISGHNLTDNRHLEFRPDFIITTPTIVKRTYQVTARWAF
jgi:iron complex outermembrane receptor protein